MNYDCTGYTVELGKLCEQIDLWAFDYPSYYKGNDKTVFENKVIDHYRFRQIGHETPARFVHYFRTRINEIMPHYIRMYESVKLMDELDNPFDNVDVVETFEESTTNTGTHSDTSESSVSGSVTKDESESKSETFKVDKEIRRSDTPQTSVSNLAQYLTNAEQEDQNNTNTGSASRESNDTSTSNAESSGSGTTSNEGTTRHTLTRKGNQGVNTYAHDIIEYRTALINVDMMIIDELKDLFLGVY